MAAGDPEGSEKTGWLAARIALFTAALLGFIGGAAIGNWAFRVLLASLAASRHMPLVWLWTALVFDHVARMALLAFEFRRGGWKRRAMKKAAAAG